MEFWQRSNNDRADHDEDVDDDNDYDVTYSLVTISLLVLQRSKPRTVQELMQKIGFQKYTQRLLDSGFDEFDFLADLDEQVLSEIGVPKEHRGMVRKLTSSNCI